MTVTEKTAEEIRSMKIRGAGKIARASAAAMRDFAEGCGIENLEDFRREAERNAEILLASRPTAVSLWNGVKATMKGLDDAKDTKEAKELLCRNAEAFIEASSTAIGAIAKIGAKRIEDDDIVMTHCNSSAALGVIKEAHKQGKEFRVYATESRPWRQGILTVKELAAEGVDVTLIIDSAVHTVMKKTDKVFVGADTITSHGALVNKIGTSQLALAAHEARVQFYACSETYKFSPATIFGEMVTIEEREVGEVVREGEIPDSVKIFNPVFDITPAAYIDAIITEEGMIHPASVYEIMVRQLGGGVLRE